jgi:hypothetical protein
MTDDREARIDGMTTLASRVQASAIGHRLASAMFTDGLVGRVLRDTLDDVEEMRAIARGMTAQAVADVAEREIQRLNDDERDHLMAEIGDEFQNNVVVAVRHAWTVAEALSIPPDRLDPEAIAFIAALYVIPIDATHPPHDPLAS